MDCYGTAHTAPEGEYFWSPVWSWHPLADFIIETLPEIAVKCEHWHTNDGAGLDAEDSVRLADELDKMLADGTAAAYIDIRDATLQALPNEACKFCDGTGTRSDDVGRTNGFTERAITEPDHPRHGQTGWCNICNGRGWNRPVTWYQLELDDVREFSAFIRASGGFSIC